MADLSPDKRCAVDHPSAIKLAIKVWASLDFDAEAKAMAREILARNGLETTPSHAPRKPEPWAYAVMQPKGAEFDYLVFPDYGEAESHVADAEDEREIIPLFPPSVPSTTPRSTLTADAAEVADYLRDNDQPAREWIDRAVELFQRYETALVETQDTLLWLNKQTTASATPHISPVRLAEWAVQSAKLPGTWEQKAAAFIREQWEAQQPNNRADGGKQT